MKCGLYVQEGLYSQVTLYTGLTVHVYGKTKYYFEVTVFQISPVYLESILLSHPSVEDAAVVGVEHGVDGHVPAAFVVCNTIVSKSTLADFVNCK